MAEAYNLDEVKTAFRSIENTEGFPVVISEMHDEEGGFIVINFDHDDFMEASRATGFYTVAMYLVTLRKAIQDVGARVTLNETSGDYDNEKTG
jgi:hypothetical protein